MNWAVDDGDVHLAQGDALEVLRQLPGDACQTCVTSPPYWGQRDYAVPGQLGLEATPAEFVANLVAVLGEVSRVLRPDGTLWLNLGDCYAGGSSGLSNLAAWSAEHARSGAHRDAHARQRRGPAPGLQAKDLMGMPWRVAFALQADGWVLRSDVIWSKPNPTPQSVTDRPTTAHEYVFLMARQPRYFYDADAVREPHAEPWRSNGRVEANSWSMGGAPASRETRPMAREYHPDGRNLRSVWEFATQPMPEAHFATFPEALAERCIMAGSREGDVVLDPFIGSGTTALVARRLGRRCIGIDLSADYLEIAARRTQQLSLLGGTP